MSPVFITENEIDFLAFPPLDDSLVIFGAGYGIETLAEATWMHAAPRPTHYTCNGAFPALAWRLAR